MEKDLSIQIKMFEKECENIDKSILANIHSGGVQKKEDWNLEHLWHLRWQKEMFKFALKILKEKQPNQRTKPLPSEVITNLKNAFAEVDNNDLKLIREYCENGLKEGTGICASPETGDFSNGWNECRQEAFVMKNNLLQGILYIIDSDLKTQK